MFFIALLLLSSFSFIPNQCYQFSPIGEPFQELAEFLELLSFNFETDVFVEFAFEDSSLYESYSETVLNFVQQHNGITALRFELDVLPLRAYRELILHTDSLEVLK